MIRWMIQAFGATTYTTLGWSGCCEVACVRPTCVEDDLGRGTYELQWWYLSAVYTVYDEGFEEDGAVVGLSGEFIDHAGLRQVRLVVEGSRIGSRCLVTRRERRGGGGVGGMGRDPSSGGHFEGVVGEWVEHVSPLYIPRAGESTNEPTNQFSSPTVVTFSFFGLRSSGSHSLFR
jgi:hypothetical protein